MMKKLEIKSDKKCKSIQEIEKSIEKIKNQLKVKTLPIITNVDMDPNKILATAYDELDSVVLAGFDKDGEYYFASSVTDGGDIVWLLEKMKNKLMNMENYE